MPQPQDIDRLRAPDIEQLIQSADSSGDVQPQQGYHGAVHVVMLHGTRLIVKSVAPARPLGWLRRRMLANEYRAYQRLKGFNGVPACHGLINHRYLLLEYIEGTAFSDLSLKPDDALFDNLLELIKGLHERGVSHADLKRPDNLLLGQDNKPYLVDFGTAIVRRRGFRPLNHFFFNVAVQLDFNGWIKNKYKNRADPISDADMQYYKPMRLEQAARWFRRKFRRQWAALRQKLAHR